MLADIQRGLVELEWRGLKVMGSGWLGRGLRGGKWLPALGAAAAGMGYVTAGRLGLVTKCAARGMAAWQVYRQLKAFWKARGEGRAGGGG
jgi:hypothetical protein